jgi:hypothetical protein
VADPLRSLLHASHLLAPDDQLLPAPAAPFRPMLRLYQPATAVLDGSYQIPPIRKATG